jgi:hypothetical protein
VGICDLAPSRLQGAPGLTVEVCLETLTFPG